MKKYYFDYIKMYLSHNQEVFFALIQYLSL